MSVEDRTALVTGAGNGLGRAIACRLAGAGARVILVGRVREKLDAVAGEVTGAGGSARVASADVSSPGTVAGLAQLLTGEMISILINNAGVAGPSARS